MRYNSIENKIAALVALPLIGGLWLLVILAIRHESNALIALSDRGSDLLASSVIRSIESAMEDLHAPPPDGPGDHKVRQLIAAVIANQKTIGEVQELQLLLQDGSEAFGLATDSTRLSKDMRQHLANVWETGRSVTFREEIGNEPLLTHLKPVRNGQRCQECHGRSSKLRAVVRVSTSMSAIQCEVALNRRKLILVAAMTSLIVAGILKILIRAIIARPIRQVADEIAEVAAGKHARPVRVSSSDEIGDMVDSFNIMALNLRKTQQDLLQSAKLASIGELAGSVAHEINNPAAIILTRIDCLEQEATDDSLTPEVRRELSVIRKHTKIIAEVTRALLTFARRSSAESNRSLVDLNKLAVDTMALIDRQFQSRNIKVELCLSDSLPHVSGNSTELQQVLLNLATNARDVMPEGGRVRIETWHSEKDSGTVFLRFSDTGKGITPGNLEKVFDPFFTTKDIGKGTGLGLSVSYGIVKEHHGDINVTSSLDEGTVFLVSLPVARELAQT